jgi:predicted MPP superfamily phosphohydrolase
MFHTIITVAYIIPNIYVFLRIGQLFISKNQRLIYAVIYLLLALAYPVNNFFIEGESELKYNIVTLIARYILPFYLYLFLSLLVFDIFLLINRFAKLVQPETMRGRKFRIAALTALLIIPMMVVVGGIINFNTIRVSEYMVTVPRKASKIDHLRIAFASDFHLKERTDIRFVEQFAAKVATLQPDLMIFGGDIVEGDKDDGKISQFEDIFRKIPSRYGVYAVLGNHEYYGGQDKGNFFDKSGMKMLCDTIVVVDQSFNLAGRLDSHFQGRKSIGDLMKSVTDSLPVILIDHRPTELLDVSKTTVDVQLSGHTHDGQLFPLNLIIDRIYELGYGYKKIANTHFFVSSGIMLWGPPVRTTGKSEILVVDVEFK